MRFHWHPLHFAVLLLACCSWACTPQSDTAATDQTAADYEAAHPADDHDEHGHDDHGHDEHGHEGHDHHGHSHEALGPHEGHLIEIGDEAYHAEWLHDDDSGQITMFILDSEMKEEVPIAAPSVMIRYTIGDKTADAELDAVDAGDDGKTAKFQTTSKPLIEVLKMAGQGVDAEVLVEIDGQSLRGSFAHEPH